MRRSAISILLLVAIAHVARAQDSGVQHIDGKVLGEALQDFLTEMRAQFQQDRDEIRNRVHKARQEFRERFNVGGDESSRRRALLTDGVLDAKLDKLQAGWQLLKDAGGAMWDVMDTKFMKIKDFYQEILGSDYAQYLPHNWLADNMSWDKLGEFDVNSNMIDFLSHTDVQTLTRPQSLEDLYTNTETIKDHFCKPDGFTNSTKKFTECKGPSIRLAFEPKSCYFLTKEKQIICDPAKIVIEKHPGFCALKHFTAPEWKGKECKISGQCGFAKNHTIGFKHVDVTLPKIEHDFDLNDLFHKDNE